MKRRVTLWSAHLCLCAILCCGAVSAFGQAPDVWQRTVTISVKDEPFPEVVKDLFTDTDARYEITPAAQRFLGSNKVTAKLDMVSLKIVVESLVRTAGFADGKRLVARFEKDLCTIDVADTGGKPADVAVGNVRKTLGTSLSGGPSKTVLVDTSPNRKLVSFEGQDVTAFDVLKSVLETAKTGWRIHPSLRSAMAAKHVSVKYKDSELQNVLSQLIAMLALEDRSVSFFYEPKGDNYVFLPLLKESPADAESAPVSISIKGKLAGIALEQLFASSKLSIAYSPEDLMGTRATVPESRQTPVAGAAAILRSAGVEDRFQIDGWRGVFAVVPKQVEIGRFSTDRRIVAHFEYADVRFALKALFAVAGGNFVVDQNVTGRVTVEIENLPLHEAIEKVLESSKGPLSIKYTNDNGVYRFTHGTEYETWK